MKKFEFEWNLYPQEKPKKDGSHFITVEDKNGRFTMTAWWNESRKRFGLIDDEFIKAWAELPKPYKEEKHE